MKAPQLNQISQHVYWFPPDERTDRPVLGAVVGERATLIIDAGNSSAHAGLFLSELAKIDAPAPAYLVLTHSHWDHVFGVCAYDLPVFAHEETARIVAEMCRLDWSDDALDGRVAEGTEIEFCRDMIKVELPNRTDLRLRAPDVSFASQLPFELGGVTCVVKHVGGDHAADSSIVHVPDDGIVFLSDCLYQDLHHGPRNYTTQKLFPLIDKIVSLDAANYLWGHDPEPMSVEGMATFAGLLKSIGQRVEQIGDDREAILLALQDIPPGHPEDDPIEIADAFLAGLRGKL